MGQNHPHFGPQNEGEPAEAESGDAAFLAAGSQLAPETFEGVKFGNSSGAERGQETVCVPTKTSLGENVDTYLSLKRHLLSFWMALILLYFRPDLIWTFPEVL